MKIHFLTSCVIMVVLLLIVDAVSAQMQVEAHSDFSGGMVNSIANAKMQDNQLVMLDNFDVTDVGYLTRRHGLELHYTDPSSGDPLMALFAYYKYDSKQLIVIRRHGDYFSNDTADSNFLTLTRCDETTSTCTTTVIGGWYDPTRFTNIPYNRNNAIVNQNLILSALNSELVSYDGDSLFFARPYGPGQIKAYTINGGGNVTGPVVYKCLFFDTTLSEYSSLSNPSWTQYPISGKVVLRLPAPIDTTRQDLIRILRKAPLDSLWGVLADVNIHQGDSLIYIDNLLSTSGTMSYIWGYSNSRGTDFLGGPGAPTRTIDFGYAGGPLTKIDSLYYGTPGIFQDSLERVWIDYRIIFVDSAGRQSYASPSIDDMVKDTTNTDTTFSVTLHDLPVPSDPKITKKIIVRRIDPDEWWGTFEDSVDQYFQQSYYIIDTIDASDTTWVDIYPSYTYATDARRWIYQEDLAATGDNIYPYTAETFNYDDSTVRFMPRAMAYHGNRLYLVGYPEYPDRVYYSDFGKPTTIGNTKFLSIPSPPGDWFVGLLSLGNDRLMALRQNSIVVIGGLSFYQYSIEEAIRGVGLSAPRSVASGANRVYFAHTTGIYEFSRFGGPDDRPISWPIANSIDSLIDSLPQSWGQIINGNYWWSADSVTYIYDQFPVPHWKTYSFGVRDAAEFDYDPEVRDYRPNKVILALDNDSLYRWGYDDTATTDAGAAFTARFKTKAFLEGPNRKRVWWLQINGTGTCDSLKLTYYDDNGRDSVGYDILYPDFSDNVVDRIAINRLFTNFAFRLEDFGAGDYTIYGYEFAWQPSDGGKK